MSVHTSGSWKSENEGRNVFGIYAPRDPDVGNRWQVAICFTEEDAKLIAAAPDLLVACQQALYLLRGREHDQFLRDAIAKATTGSAK